MEQVVSFGDWVRRRRKMLDLTQVDLAQQVSCSVSMLRKIERDERRPSNQLAELLAEHLAIADQQRSQFLQMARGQFAPDMPMLSSAELEQDDSQQPPNRTSVVKNPFFLGSGAALLVIIVLLLINTFSERGTDLLSADIFGGSTSVADDSENTAFSSEVIENQAASGDLAGRTVVIEGPISADGIELFERSVLPFEERTGIDVIFRGIPNSFEAYIADVAAVGNPPDIVSFPQPGYLADFARKGELIALDAVFDNEYLLQQYSSPLLELATVDGHVYGAPHMANLKGLIWYPKKEFEAAGYEVPHTWTELMALSDQMVAEGRTPWCIGIESGEASGWIGTDWAESLLLRTAPPDVYDAWTEGKLPFDSTEIRRVLDLMEPIWLNADYVYGGTTGILETPTWDAATPMFEDPPGCFLLYGATFSPGLFPQDTIYGEDYDFFLLPAVDPKFGQPLLGAGSYYAMFTDRPEVWEAMRYLTTGESIKVFAETGSNVSTHRDVPLEWYTTPKQLRYAQLFAEADVYRFDGSDLMPGEVGFRFWQGIVDWVAGKDLDTILQEIDNSWPGKLEQLDPKDAAKS